MVNQTATRAGKAYERELLNYFRSLGLDAERLRLTGVQDEGDLVLKIGFPLIVEAKREKGFNLAGWLSEAQDERRHYTSHRGLDSTAAGFVVVHKARGKSVDQSYVTTTLAEYLWQVGAAD